MSVEQALSRLSLPVIAAPMFLVSGPELVIEACRSGIVGAFPALNQRTSDGYKQWLEQIEEALAQPSADGAPVGPHAVNLIVHKTNKRLDADLKLTVEHRVPVVITSLGASADVISAVHGYGGQVFHDVVNMRQAEKVVGAGVDGVIGVAAGAGGHGGTLNPFAFIHELRRLTDKKVILAGAIATGAQVAAAIVAGADMVSVGTRFIATRESRADDAYKAMVTRTSAGDIIYTPKISGVNANFIIQSLIDHKVDLDALRHDGPVDMGAELSGDGKAWKDLWSAGHGSGAVRDIPGVAELVLRMRKEARQALANAALRNG